MNFKKRHAWLLIFVLVSLFVLIVYDLFHEVEKRGVVTEARNFPRVYRTLLLFISAGFYFSSFAIKKFKFNQIFVVIYLLIILNILIYWSFSIESLIAISKILYLLFIYLFFFKFYSYYNNKRTEKYLNIFISVCIVALTLHIIASRLNIIGNNSDLKVYGDNNSYILLAFLPMLFLSDKIQFKKLLILLLTIGIFLGLKRGAMAALLISLVGSFILESKLHNIRNILDRFKRFFVIIISTTILLSIYFSYTDLFNERFGDFFNSDGESFGSGRGNIYTLIWKDWYSSDNFKTYLLGNGYNSVQDFTQTIIGSPLMAHSDLFNFLHSYGLLGIILLFMFSFHQLKTIIKLYMLKHKLVVPYFILFIIFLFKSVYSGNFESPNFIYLLIGFGTLNSILHVNKINV